VAVLCRGARAVRARGVEGSVNFVSDDGCLYCVDAADGKLRWKVRGLPPGTADRRLLGSGRLISLFPARGGPVLRDGVIYFGAGLWSSTEWRSTPWTPARKRRLVER